MKKTFLPIILLLTKVCFSQIVNIPDTNFKYVLTHSSGYPFTGNGYDTNSNGEIEVSEANNIIFLSINNNNLQDLTGIKNFVNLKYLYCPYNYIQNLDLENLSNLEELDCSYNNNQLSNINLAGCISLRTINCGANVLTSLNLTGLNSLVELNCDTNLINNLDFSNTQSLKKVSALNSYGLHTITFENCNQLEEIRISESALINVSLSRLNNLKYVTFNNNIILNTLNLNTLPSLQYLECINNKIQNLNLSAAPNLIEVDCHFNELTKLDFKNIDFLKFVNCSNNNLTELIINNPTYKDLIGINCSYNKLKGLTIKQPINGLLCVFNNLTSLDLSNQNQMGGFDCSNNPIQYINLMNSFSLPFYSPNGNYIHTENCPNLKFVCANDFQKDNLDAYFYSINKSDVEVSSSCDFKPVLSPNPAKNSLTITSAVFIKNITVISPKGDVVLSFKGVNNHFLNTDISMLMNGMYFVQVEGQYNDKYVAKLIKH